MREQGIDLGGKNDVKVEDITVTDRLNETKHFRSRPGGSSASESGAGASALPDGRRRQP